MAAACGQPAYNCRLLLHRLLVSTPKSVRNPSYRRKLCAVVLRALRAAAPNLRPVSPFSVAHHAARLVESLGIHVASGRAVAAAPPPVPAVPPRQQALAERIKLMLGVEAR